MGRLLVSTLSKSYDGRSTTQGRTRMDSQEQHGQDVVSAESAPIDIDALIDAITNKNRHEATDMGPRAGAEFW